MEALKEQLQKCLREAEAQKLLRIKDRYQRMQQMAEHLNWINKEVALKDYVRGKRDDYLRTRVDLTTEIREGFRTRTRELEAQIKDLEQQKQRQEDEERKLIENYVDEVRKQRHLQAINGGKWDESDIVLPPRIIECHVRKITANEQSL